MANWSKLSKAWTKDFLTPASEISPASRITSAIERTLPLLQDPTSVPFVCRYRADVIQPLSTKQIHRLSDHLQRYNSLHPLRKKILPFLQEDKDRILISRVETSISKTELEDIYAPFKPPSKGSLEDRIRKEHPHLIPAIDELWQNRSRSRNQHGNNDGRTTSLEHKLYPRDAAVTLLANRIANHVPVMDAVMDFCSQQCRIKVKQQTKSSGATTAAKSSKLKSSKQKQKGSRHGSPATTTAVADATADKYKAYFDFDCKVSYLKEYQTLAIRRGSDNKVLKYTFEIDSTRAQSIIAGTIQIHNNNNNNIIPQHIGLYKDAIYDAWTRLIRKRVTGRLWKRSCQIAEEGATEVFCDNLRKALLAPPLAIPKPILVLDPGFKAGIKCAVLDSMGRVESLITVDFMGGLRESGKAALVDLLRHVQRLVDDDDNDDDDDENAQIIPNVCVVVGNGHGMREARELILEVGRDENIPIDIEIVNEAGASVWSVTEMASKEFPNESAASVAAVSIGRRYQNPLNELVKIPPRSLGLGMYQHDLAEKDLDGKLTVTSIDAVAEVGVDINACSAEILEKVPSLTKSMCDKILKIRPLESRQQLLRISGIGPKTFESCAAFVRVPGGSEPLDDTLVHPESYDLAHWLLKQLKFELGNPNSVAKLPSGASRDEKLSAVAEEAARLFDCTKDRVFTVIEHLIFSITRPDPRLSPDAHKENKIGSTAGCLALPMDLSSPDSLRKACPLRCITATIRNVVDFGAFVDFGGEKDGLLHRSKLGNVPLDSLLIGQEVGIDILGVSKFGKISVGLTGQNLSVEDLDQKRPHPTKDRSGRTKRRRKI